MVKIAFRESAKHDLRKFSHPLRRLILSACHEIFDDWGIGKVLTGRLSSYRVHRMGVYRILYAVKESSHIEIVAIGHRKDIYERSARSR